eukprot:1182542-Prorocentrum_minimum.AAC.1
MPASVLDLIGGRTRLSLVAAFHWEGRAHMWTPASVIGKDVQMWMRADEPVFVKMRAALRAKRDQRPVVLMDHDFVYSSLSLFRQVRLAQTRAPLYAGARSTRAPLYAGA